jgi:hypothetical protein
MENEFHSYGFIPFENYLPFKTIDELIERCNFIFNENNKVIAEKIRLAGFEFVKNKHLLNNRIQIITPYL